MWHSLDMNATFVVLLILGYLLIFPLFWMAVVWLVSRFGWAAMAEHWQTTNAPMGQSYSMVTGRIGISNYRNTLHVWVSEQGLFLEPIWLFRFGHRRLFIPWQAVQNIQSSHVMWFQGAKLELLHGLTMTLYGRAGTDMLEIFKPKN